jgi:hypothetical protein
MRPHRAESCFSLARQGVRAQAHQSSAGVSGVAALRVGTVSALLCHDFSIETFPLNVATCADYERHVQLLRGIISKSRYER